MQIFLNVIQSENGVKEWAMIELQGDLGSKEDSLAGQFVGDLYYNKDGTPIFIIGHHILFGKVQKLDKPLGVLEKKREPTDSKTEYTLKAIVHKKIVFRDRPKPIVALCNISANNQQLPKISPRKAE